MSIKTFNSWRESLCGHDGGNVAVLPKWVTASRRVSHWIPLAVDTGLCEGDNTRVVTAVARVDALLPSPTHRHTPKATTEFSAPCSAHNCVLDT